ncbi:PilW family protein [Psychrobacter sp. ANT_H3]|uniref:PilW family protein n=1 Tax=Psychrobacter sp. ANT_H3 TaxID=3019444 RepID=UPI0022F16F99|nr:PilW family protein [Psychrobacter sp. ANT_H3]MDA5133800.1 PilW family protein [Psychrobacter sp. ANT_H3]
MFDIGGILMESYHAKSYPSTVSSVDVAGFTLIELMISLVLGLLISAAVIQVYIISTRTITVQQGASEVQDSTIFALQSLEDRIRIANLGNPITNINDNTRNGGIVLTGNNIGNNSYANTGYLTVSAGQTGTKGANGWTGISNTNIASDQLTIQYRNITPNPLFDCEGKEIGAGSSDWVIERYFVRPVTGNTPVAGSQKLVLACDAGRLTSAGAVTALGDNGEVMIPAIDQFKVLLGTLSDVDNLTYLPSSIYLDVDKPLVGEKPAITTIKLGVIIRSSTPMISSVDKNSFNVFGADNTLKAETAKYYRRSYESTNLLRNARVMSVTGMPTNSN